MSIRSSIVCLATAVVLTARFGTAPAAPLPAKAPATPATPAPAPTRAVVATAPKAPTPPPAVSATPARAAVGRKSVTREARPAAPSAPDSVQKLKGGQEGTAFRTLTIEGEDRIRMDYERPVLDLDLDPEQAAGLSFGSGRDLLDRTTPDATLPLLALTAREPSPYLARPWLRHIASGAVARFHPDVKGVERWTLVVADSRGGQVASFEGRGEPPAEIAWDGSTRAGTPARPGLTYSYVFQARDRAGNKRNFVGEGFQIPAYRLDSPHGTVMMIPGEDLGAAPRRATAGAPSATSPVTLEAASVLNQLSSPATRIQVTAVARTQERANALAAGVSRDLSRLVLGNPARVTGVGTVEPDAPAAGTVRIEATR